MYMHCVESVLPWLESVLLVDESVLSGVEIVQAGGWQCIGRGWNLQAGVESVHTVRGCKWGCTFSNQGLKVKRQGFKVS